MNAYAQTTSDTVYTVYNGAWINWTHGRVLGLTLTLNRRQGDLLIAFTALFVTIVGTSFWRIACFLIHSLYSSEGAQDGLYHQRQAILRNSANGTSGLIRLVQVLLAWRKNASKPVKRILPLIAFAVLSVYGFGAASGFSSRVSTGIGNEVLISSANCAAPVAISNNVTEQLEIYWPYTTRQMSSYSNYAQQCYNDSEDGKCDTFVTKSLDVQITRNATCPFSKEMCKSQDQNIYFDTGLLDTHDDLGFNMPSDQRFQYRRTTHCAPLVSEGYKAPSNYTAPDTNFDTAYMKYYYGPKTSDTNETATYKYPLLNNQQAADRKTLSAAADYSIGSVEAWGLNGSIAGHSTFAPIAPLLRPDADTAIVFLSSNDIGYWGTSADPWYGASRLGGYFYVPAAGADSLGLGAVRQAYYYGDEPASALGCVARAQWCNPRMGTAARCTPLSGYLDLNANVDGIVRDGAERRLLDWYRWAVLRDAETLAAVPAALGVASLPSRFGLNYGMRARVAEGQWMRDVEQWHAVSMTALQGRAVDTAAGPGGGGGGGGGMEKFVVRPNSTEAEGLCRNQVRLACLVLFCGDVDFCAGRKSSVRRTATSQSLASRSSSRSAASLSLRRGSWSRLWGSGRRGAAGMHTLGLSGTPMTLCSFSGLLMRSWDWGTG